jgi:hypothetical protein
MSIPDTGLRTQRTRLLIAVAVCTLGCANPFNSFTYKPDLKNVPLPPGVKSDPSQFRADVAARPGGVGPSHNHQRLGNCKPPCLVNVTIAPVGNTLDVNPIGGHSPVGPSSGRVVAKILNLDPTFAEEMYGFQPSSQFEYYVWADTTGGGSRARMTLLEVPAPGKPGTIRAIFQKRLDLCVHDDHEPASTDADFRWCLGTKASTGSSVTEAGMLSLGPLGALLTRVSELVAGTLFTQPPLWLRCTDGCCS